MTQWKILQNRNKLLHVLLSVYFQIRTFASGTIGHFHHALWPRLHFKVVKSSERAFRLCATGVFHPEEGQTSAHNEKAYLAHLAEADGSERRYIIKNDTKLMHFEHICVMSGTFGHRNTYINHTFQGSSLLTVIFNCEVNLLKPTWSE